MGHWIANHFVGSLLLGVVMVIAGAGHGLRNGSRLGWLTFAGGFVVLIWAMKLRHLI